ncbi:MAG: universal stress protein [Burkholderiaceae bacterium]|nr:universal stress protein [Burkholderiaceae bacterium]
MDYKTVLVHLDQSPRCDVRVTLAAQLSQSVGGHLIGAAMTGISRHVFSGAEFDLSDPVFAHHRDHLRQHARDVLKHFEQVAASVGVDTVEPRLVDDDAAGGMVLQARYADLTVMGQFDAEATIPGVMSNLPELVVLGSGRPVLIVPHSGQPAYPLQRVLVAWDGSLSASRAIMLALPLLLRANTVTVLVMQTADKKADVHGEQPGADLALFLARHQIKVDLVERHIQGDRGEVLLSIAADLATDLIVMGGYGHTRFRELVLGGVTRTLLQSMTVPVLMAH